MGPNLQPTPNNVIPKWQENLFSRVLSNSDSVSAQQIHFDAGINHQLAGLSQWADKVRYQVWAREHHQGNHSVIARESACIAEANRAALRLRKVLVIEDLNLSWDDQQIRDWANAKASHCERLAAKRCPGLRLQLLLADYGLNMPMHCMLGLNAAISRTCDERWWRRQARKLQGRAIDQAARDLRVIHRKGQPYCSDEVVSRRAVQKARNRTLLEELAAENDEGQVYSLAELADLSVSNPANRRADLMVRMRGFEAVSDLRGDIGLFITTSAPSAFHPTREIRNKKGRLIKVIPNPNYKEFSPKEAQSYHCKTWSRIRAELARKGIGVYGFRVTEPHNNGTPHWHMLLFVAPEHKEELQQVFQEQCLKEYGHEKGAKQYRVKVVDIDSNIGSATGYIAKYISKNIDGFKVDHDTNSDLFAEESARRIEAWASTWGIRQFQQIGGPSVTVWRELRRLSDEESGLLEEARKAADSSDWAAYVAVMGGPLCGREGQPIRAARWVEFDPETGEMLSDPINRYGEESKGQLFGIRLVETGVYIVTRFYRWTTGWMDDFTSRDGQSHTEQATELGEPEANSVTELGANWAPYSVSEHVLQPTYYRACSGNTHSNICNTSVQHAAGQVEILRGPSARALDLCQ